MEQTSRKKTQVILRRGFAVGVSVVLLCVATSCNSKERKEDYKGRDVPYWLVDDDAFSGEADIKANNKADDKALGSWEDDSHKAVRFFFPKEIKSHKNLPSKNDPIYDGGKSLD